jgi:anti-repressor protein
VNEPGLYSLVLGSRKPEAKAFKRWITHDVIPAVRQHGAYMTPETIQQALGNPDFIIQLATQLKEAQAKSAALQQKIEADAPKVLFAESVTASESSMLIGEFAKILKQNGLDIGQNRLFHRLRSEGYLCSAHGDRYNSPTQKAMELGLFEIQEGTVLSPTGANIVTRTTRLSPKGQVYFINRYLKNTPIS